MPMTEDTIGFTPSEGTIKIVNGKASIELKPDGDILVNGRVAESNKDVVNGMRDLLRSFEPRFDSEERKK